MQLQSISTSNLIPSPILHQTHHHQSNIISNQTSTSTHQISPRLDALAYVSTHQLPKLQLNQQTQSDLNPVLETTREEEEQEEEDDDGRVQAYAKLEFPQHDFFIRKLTLTIGRRPPSHSNSIQEEQDEEEPIDVDLGPIRAVSRRHARIYFDWAHGRWTLSVGGRNGCVVDGRWRAKGLRFKLQKESSTLSYLKLLHLPLLSQSHFNLKKTHLDLIQALTMAPKMFP
ncbi:hypothetical protein DFH28DRAFT_7021 [Melampsora americana]|nr:hypothetical protein DFH28DRAFT_7021 [Melampsora americana]